MMNNLVIISIADIHFGAMDPEYQYTILKEQFLNKISIMNNIDIINICGDYFDHKCMANSNTIFYANKFFNELVKVCISKDISLLLLSGTKSHDNDQLRLFYTYLTDNRLDLRIIETTKFEYVKGIKILCIPEEYNRSEQYYECFLKTEIYDMCIVHGMYKGAVYNNENFNVDDKYNNRVKIFNIDDFSLCRGCIIAGHVHEQGCFDKYFYYCGSPYRWTFGDENDKGFLITLLDTDTFRHYTHFENIECKKYITFEIDSILDRELDDIISHISNISNGVDYVRLNVNRYNKEHIPVLNILKKYYKTNNNIKLNIKNIEKEKIENDIDNLSEKYEKYTYLLDKNLSCHDKLVRYINDSEGALYTSEQLLDILKGD